MNHKPSKKRLQEGDVIKMLFKYFLGNNSQSKRHFMEDIIPFSRMVKSKQKPKKKKKKIKECKEWQLVLPIKKKTVNHFTTRK